MEMESEFSRSALLLGHEAMDRITRSRVAVFGVGGVGGYVVESLVRTGVGEIDIIDNDKVCLSNINRQIIATRKSLGRYKVDVMKERVLDINPNAIIHDYKCFFLPDNAHEFDFSKYDYIVDAIDTITAKLELINRAKEFNVPIISCMGAGNKLEPTRLEVADIYETSVCPLAKVMRRLLRARGVKDLKVVYSKENPIKPLRDLDENSDRKERATPGSVSFVPSAAGLIIASEVIKDLAVRDKEFFVQDIANEAFG